MHATASSPANQAYASHHKVRTAAMARPSFGSDPANNPLLLLQQAQKTLLRWQQDPSEVQDDETDAPSKVAINAALAYLAETESWLLSERPLSPAPLRGCAVESFGAIRLDFRATSILFDERDGSPTRLMFADNKFVGKQRF